MARKPKPLGSTYINSNGVTYIKVTMDKVWSKAWRTLGRVKAEEILRRPLQPYEKVIKSNGKKLDFDKNNLRILNFKAKEMLIVDNEAIGSTSIYDWSILHKQCVSCGLTKFKHASNGKCTKCNRSTKPLCSQPNLDQNKDS